MDNSTKKKYLQQLQEEQNYKDLLARVESEEERKKIKAFTEDVYLNLIEGFAALKKVVVEHPEKLAEVAAKRIPKE